MNGKVCLVTGANTGIGYATAVGLAERGATVVMLCRDETKGATAVRDVQQSTSNPQVELLLCDLASLVSIRQAAAEFQTRHEALHVLINNASVIPRQREVTADGFERQFVVNHLAYFLLTDLLLDVLKASALARIINVSSQVHTGGVVDFADLQSERGYRPTQVYANTKLMNVLFTFELARRLAGSAGAAPTGVAPAVTANCLHPGVVDTNLGRDYSGLPRSVSRPGLSWAEGARTSLYLATAPEVAGVTGRYFRNEREERATAVAYDEALAQRLWAISAELTGI
ncbi:MAG: SDR family oxidoreductase [Anaerolineae bacterium]|nr:SDR family oxidoreductase [Anaerolineae bacterium]